MKYLLKQNKEDKGILCDKVTIDGFDYYVSNNEINQEDYYIDFRSDGNKLEHFKEKDDWVLVGICDFKKVIATNNPNIDIPQVVDEIEKMSWDMVNLMVKLKGHYERIAANWGFKNGYKKSQETHPFSEEDMIEFSEWTKSNGKATKELLQLWKKQQPKIIYYNG